MHAAALAYIATHIPTDADSVLEFGSRNINGSPRSVTCAARYVGVDITDGPGVDVIGNAADISVTGEFDVVICAEVFEHTDNDTCAHIVINAWKHLRPGGTFIATMAGLTRAPHSAFDGGPLRGGEFYRNVSDDQLIAWLWNAGFDETYTVDERGEDLRCVAVKT